MATPRFSVVITAFNAETTLASCLRSALGQTHQDFEVVVVDDGSTDATREIAERQAADDGRVRVIHQANAGVSAARNAGIEAARSDLISFLDSDDLWLPGYLAAVDRRLGEHPEAGLVYADSNSMLDEGKLVHRLSAAQATGVAAPPSDPQRCTEELLRVNFITASSVTVRREALDRVGAFPPDLNTCEDWDLWLRISAAGYRMLIAGDEPLVLTRDTATSASKDDLAMARGVCVVLERALAAQAPGSRGEGIATAHLELARRSLARRQRTGLASAGATRAVNVLKRVRRRILRRRNWRPPPPRIEALLRAVGELP